MRWTRNMKWISVVLLLSLSSSALFGCSAAKGGKETVPVKPVQEQVQKVELLNETADEMYQKVLKGDVDGGRTVLQQISDQVTRIRFEGITSVEGMNALAETVTQAKRVFNAAKFNAEEGQLSAAKLRLATDALTHTSQPMWLQYYKVLQDDVNGLEHAAKEQNKAELQKAAEQLGQHYGIVHPSLLISRNAADVEKMDSLATFVKNQTVISAEPFKNILNAVGPMRQVLDKLFMKQETTAYLPYNDQQNPILWTLAIGSVIMMALGFAGWRLSKKDQGLVTIQRNEEV
ncbi:sporulation protein YpjB [Paenibacillus allorhizosphaerae]|uniref:Sporulation protein YpjB n=1 Tax=Paenibacillus allorhizosphaerae TaxID=2849866 RepID=A0ABN7TS27_9BACL|nr:sporulation protein YpjB [Paenibacillus allorhizosphaerae]CAG7648828.1 hypothetical protein PAECIP111802_04339 [Paenibacillus allorhizosphaerae]